MKSARVKADTRNSGSFFTWTVRARDNMCA